MDPSKLSVLPNYVKVFAISVCRKSRSPFLVMRTSEVVDLGLWHGSLRF
jgi:hypothetical protein